MRSTANPFIEDFGCIARMDLPENWLHLPQKKRNEFDLDTLIKFSAPENNEVQICFHSRGRPITEMQAEKFREILRKEPHTLSADEWRRIHEVLNRMATPEECTIASVRTELIKERMVLVAEGRWKDSEYNMYSVFIDSDGSGSIIEEIYFAAPRSDYYKHLTRARQAIKSVEWKATSQEAAKI